MKIRLDAKITNLNNCSKTQASKLISAGLVLVNNKIIKKGGYLINENDVIEIKTSPKVNQSRFQLQEWSQKIEIRYEDEWIYVVNKPKGIITHPTAHETNKTLANILKYHFKFDENSFNEPYRYGILHRLDKDTAGLILVAKNQETVNVFSKLISEHQVQRKYLALIEKKLKTTFVEVQAPIKRIDETNRMEISSDYDAKEATTIFETIKNFKNFALVSCQLKTGRTHQIRVHAKYLNCPIINDPLYGNQQSNKLGQYLFANELIFYHPFLKKEIKINLPLPKEFRIYIKNHGE